MYCGTFWYTPNFILFRVQSCILASLVDNSVRPPSQILGEDAPASIYWRLCGVFLCYKDAVRWCNSILTTHGQKLGEAGKTGEANKASKASKRSEASKLSQYGYDPRPTWPQKCLGLIKIGRSEHTEGTEEQCLRDLSEGSVKDGALAKVI